MKTLLRIDSSMRRDGSCTRRLTDTFERLWLSANPGGTVLRRCLATDPAPHLEQAAFEAFSDPDGASLSDADILAALDGRLARFKQPKRLFFLDQLPRNTMGKVQKNKLREAYSEAFT